MPSYRTIRLNYHEACQQADKLEDIASELKNISTTRLDNIMEQLAANWKGDGASLFINKSNALQNEVADSARELASTADRIRIIARRIYDAEMRAKRIAEARNS